jgi:hypothetical protein
LPGSFAGYWACALADTLVQTGAIFGLHAIIL